MENAANIVLTIPIVVGTIPLKQTAQSSVPRQVQPSAPEYASPTEVLNRSISTPSAPPLMDFVLPRKTQLFEDIC